METKPYYDIVFVVLVYKNIEVLSDFFKSLNIPYSHKVIVVNSYYDDGTERKCADVAKSNNADYLAVPNNGYSYGNNVGCQYAIDHYSFKYLMVSNSDVVLNDFEYLKKLTLERAVFAPDTKMLNGHRQNPNIPYNSRLFLGLLSVAYKYESDFLLRMAHIVNRLYREVYLLYTMILGKNSIRIFAPHGSFVIFSYQAALELMPIFNDKMFLYNEELFLAFHCRQNNVPIYYVPKLKLTHLEGASSSSTSNSWKNHKQSYSVLQQWLKNRL